MINYYNFNAITVILVITSVTFSTPIPIEAEQSSTSKSDTSLFNIPFLELKNGGVRVNFGGYHAEAGLGGLLGDSRSGGGLFASAGTPFGPHASAGLGGDVDGENGGFSRGGLHALAGLGNGGSEIATGLAGKVDGANPSKSEGKFYATQNNGGKTRFVVKNINDKQSNDIQHNLPSSNIKFTMQDNDLVVKKEMVSNTEANIEIIRREVALSDGKFNAVEPNVVPVTNAPVHAYPTRRCRRKRLCNNGIRQTAVNQPLPLTQKTVVNSDVEKHVPTYSQLLLSDELQQDRLTADNTGYKDVITAPGPVPSLPHSLIQRPRSTTIFDDIFNIPISALVAVNQLLNNKAG